MPTPSPIIVASVGAIVGTVDDVAEEADQRQRDPEPDHRRDDRQPHRDEAAETKRG